MDWREIMSRYQTLANMTDRPENLYIVAPDKVGDQAGTIEVLEAWALKVRSLIDEGCQVIVPLRGAVDLNGGRSSTDANSAAVGHATDWPSASWLDYQRRCKFSDRRRCRCYAERYS